MRRVLPIVLVLAVAVAAIVLVARAAGDDDGSAYEVRAIFDNAFSVIPGEDVKISGVKVGSISALDLTKDRKAAVVLRIDEPGFKDFRSDATCTIRPQSLIGERYVECTPTEPKAEGQAKAPPLHRIEDGEGKGQYLLPTSRTSRPVDLDLVNDIMQRPYRERLSLILNELGTGLAANGDELREAIRRANPALAQTDKVLKILADQNKVLADLAENGDRVLAPLARDRDRVASFISKVNTTAQASAERREDIEATIDRFPAFLRELKPTMTRLGALADQMTPVLRDLGKAAPEINTFVKQLGPFSEAAIPAIESLGEASVVGREALLKSKPIVTDLRSFASDAKPLTKNLSSLLTSLQETGGVERLMDFIFYSVSSVNGYDSFGHYLRAILVVNTCSTYVTANDQACTANFVNEDEGGDAASASTRAKVSADQAPTPEEVQRQIDAGRSPNLAREDAVLRGTDPKSLEGIGDATGTAEGEERSSSPEGKAKAETATPAAGAKIELPSTFLPGQPAEAPKPAAAEPAPSSATQTLLDYLLG